MYLLASEKDHKVIVPIMSIRLHWELVRCRTAIEDCVGTVAAVRTVLSLMYPFAGPTIFFAKLAGELGVKSHRALGCRSFSRVDMMMDKAGKIFVLEVNTIPGMTERSLLPKAAGAAGIGFGAFVEPFWCFSVF